MSMFDWRALAGWLRARAENCVALLLGSMFSVFIVQVAFRYILNLPLGWTLEYVTIAWLWGILFGYAFVIRSDDRVSFDIVYGVMPKNVRRAMDVVSGLVCAAIFAWSLPKTVGYIAFMHLERTDYLHIPFDVVFSIYVPFALSVIARSLMTVWHGLRGDRGVEHEPTPGAHEYV
jgi:C4-dicarboxylate transporter DctQ subunit